jgi:hypothetical protein
MRVFHDAFTLCAPTEGFIIKASAGLPLGMNYGIDELSCCKVGVAFSSVALERSLRMATLKKNKLGEISEEDDLQVTLKTAASLKQALLGLGTTFIKGFLLYAFPFSEVRSFAFGPFI